MNLMPLTKSHGTTLVPLLKKAEKWKSMEKLLMYNQEMLKTSDILD